MNQRALFVSAAFAGALLVSVIATADDVGRTIDFADGWLGVRADVVFGGNTVTVNDIMNDKPFQCGAIHDMKTSGWSCDANPSSTGLKEIAVKCIDECLQAFSGGERLEQCRYKNTVVETWNKDGDCKERHFKMKTFGDLFPTAFEHIDLKKILCEKARDRVPAEYRSTFKLKNLELWGRREYKGGDRKDFRKIMFYPSFSCYQPDLIVDSLELSPASPKAGDKVTFKAVIKNVGGVSAGPVQATITAANKPGSPMQIPKLDPGASWTPIRGIYIEGAQTYLFEVVVDPSGTVAEGDEGNNSKSRTFKVKE